MMDSSETHPATPSDTSSASVELGQMGKVRAYYSALSQAQGEQQRCQDGDELRGGTKYTLTASWRRKKFQCSDCVDSNVGYLPQNGKSLSGEPSNTSTLVFSSYTSEYMTPSIVYAGSLFPRWNRLTWTGVTPSGRKTHAFVLKFAGEMKASHCR